MENHTVKKAAIKRLFYLLSAVYTFNIFVNRLIHKICYKFVINILEKYFGTNK